MKGRGGMMEPIPTDFRPEAGCTLGSSPTGVHGESPGTHGKNMQTLHRDGQWRFKANDGICLWKMKSTFPTPLSPCPPPTSLSAPGRLQHQMSASWSQSALRSPGAYATSVNNSIIETWTALTLSALPRWLCLPAQVFCSNPQRPAKAMEVCHSDAEGWTKCHNGTVAAADGFSELHAKEGRAQTISQRCPAGPERHSVVEIKLILPLPRREKACYLPPSRSRCEATAASCLHFRGRGPGQDSNTPAAVPTGRQLWRRVIWSDRMVATLDMKLTIYFNH
uniref:uncharacterized protein LOC131114699 n=1 Tax=Doryrhamphus excisus TaxID=161450 RepID=UPI0025AE9249|nr:uncharacterized protein LOC131114699 [Doryrhamphus excisus]